MAPITVEQIVEYYKNLLIIQYKGKPKAEATIALIAEIQAMDNVEFDVESGFDINTAVGKQLDILGKWLGVNRDYQGTNYPDNIFGFTDYAGADSGQEGFSDYADYTTKVGTFLTYNQIVGNKQKLNDEDYRIVLRLQIVCNNANMSQSAIDNLLFDYFGYGIIASSDNLMDLTYFISPSVAKLGPVLLEKKVLPKPMAVRVSAIATQDKPIFSLVTYGEDLEQAEIDVLREGFSTYADFDSKLGSTLTYADLIS